jgi:uncharacterized membrane protein (DUF4010 family)
MHELTEVWTSTDVHLLVRLAVAAGIGFLIGLEREFAKQVRDRMPEGSTPEKKFAGLRTFTLIALLGFLSALFAANVGGWFFGLTLAGFVALLITSYKASIQRGEVGATSEVTALITFLLGGLAFEGHLLFIIIVAVLVLLLLSFKLPLHRFVTTLTEQDVRAIIEFVVLTVLVLPFLPDQGCGPHGTWNPKEIWTMVVLVSGISLVGYLLAKVLGHGKGTLLTGILGGLVSSTAVALSFARRSAEGVARTQPLALGIVAASAIMFLRVLLELFVVNRSMAMIMLVPLVLIAGVGLFTAWRMNGHRSDGDETSPVLTNPLNFRIALQFALLYALVRWVVVWADERFGQAGTYVAGALAGITDVDAITLSMARMGLSAGWETQALVTILIASTVNTLVKLTIVMVVGGPALRKQVLPGFVGMAAAAALSIVWVALR